MNQTQTSEATVIATRIGMVTVDCADPVAEAEFWAALLGGEIAAATQEYAMVVFPAGPALGFGCVDDFEPPAWPNPHGSKQFHLDLAVTDIAATEQQALGLGASLAEPQPGETWRVLIDPAGHPFCLSDAKNWG
ncbi:VOC family protein [Brooklawnia sp.]|uniref:VOC family protein n=1 Tax=Brooklawnia sp. TaxID=2699740 RepID=UPI003120382C